MDVNPEPADPTVREEQHLAPKSYADAAEEALTRDDNEPVVDEAAIKETPPPRKFHVRSSSGPRPLGEIMDEVERSPPPGSPLLRHPRGRLENKDKKGSHESWAEVVKDDPSLVDGGAEPTTNGHDAATNGNGDGAKHTNGGFVTPPIAETEFKHTNGGNVTPPAPETFAGVGEDTEPRTPIRKVHKRVSSRSLRGSSSGSGTRKAKHETAVDGSRDDDTVESGALVYENLHSKSGENLASIKPQKSEYELSLSQRKDKEESTALVKSKQQNNSLVSGRRAGAGWSTSAIRWAPMNVPLQRRLQTLVVLWHTVCIVVFLALFFIICAIPLSWPLVVPYLIYLTFSRAGVDGELYHRSEWLRRSKVWSLFGAYLPARLHRTVELEPTRKYIFGYHPHGIISHGAFIAFGTEALGFSQLFPGIKNTLLTLDANFNIPLYRDYALRLGLASVSRESCENILSKGGRNGEGMGRAITIVVGGARESLDASPNTLRLVLKRRKGFVKLAIRNGADLVPTLSFGENDLYDQVNGEEHPVVKKIQLMLKNFMGFTVPLFHARGIFNYDVGVMPYRRPVNIVVGKPIKVLQNAKPDPAYVDKIHEQYMTELEGIWENWKEIFAPHRREEMVYVE